MHFQAILHNISYISPIAPNSFAASQNPRGNHEDRARGCKRGNVWRLMVDS